MGSMLLKVFSNNPDDGTERILSKFVDNTKLEKAVNILKGRTATQRDLDKLKKWVARNITKFSKSKVLHVGGNKITQHYRLGPNRLGSSSAGKHMGVIVDKKLTTSQQHVIAAEGCIRKRVTSKSRGVILPLCSALLRPHLEYCVLFWAPQCKIGIDTLE